MQTIDDPEDNEVNKYLEEYPGKGIELNKDSGRNNENNQELSAPFKHKQTLNDAFEKSKISVSTQRPLF